MPDHSLQLLFYHPTERGVRKRKLLNLPGHTEESKRASFQQNFGDAASINNINVSSAYDVTGYGQKPQTVKWKQDLKGAVQLEGYINRPLINVDAMISLPQGMSVNPIAGTAGKIRNNVSRAGPEFPFPKVSEINGQYGDANVGLYNFNLRLNAKDPLSVQFARKLFDPVDSKRAKELRVITDQEKLVEDHKRNKTNATFKTTFENAAKERDAEYRRMNGSGGRGGRGGRGGSGGNYGRRGGLRPDSSDTDEGGPDDGMSGGGISRSTATIVYDQYQAQHVAVNRLGSTRIGRDDGEQVGNPTGTFVSNSVNRSRDAGSTTSPNANNVLYQLNVYSNTLNAQYLRTDTQIDSVRTPVADQGLINSINRIPESNSSSAISRLSQSSSSRNFFTPRAVQRTRTTSNPLDSAAHSMRLASNQDTPQARVPTSAAPMSASANSATNINNIPIRSPEDRMAAAQIRRMVIDPRRRSPLSDLDRIVRGRDRPTTRQYLRGVHQEL